MVKGKREQSRSLSLKAKKESSDEESSTSDSEDEEHAMAVRDFKKVFKNTRKSPRSKNQRVFVGGTWSDNDKDEKDKTKDETCLVVQTSNEVRSETKFYSDDLSSIDDLDLDSAYHRLCRMGLKVIVKNIES
ncbi:hypothetical protein Tco_1033271 [Tanacetum coccineum]|uniref:Transposase, Ptta/En/Spm, transposase, Tnp1/En/Spm-like protein n=1 Tax=Tanacetum coccineum TaxID=301880 RepID=A0ABQ5GE67_9ASTR